MPRQKPYDIFISYKSQQASWAVRLANSLRDCGLDVWRDDDAVDGLRVNEDFNIGIQQAIEASEFFVLFWSERANTGSTYIINEIDHAKSHRKKIIQVNLDSTAAPAQLAPLNLHPFPDFRELFLALPPGQDDAAKKARDEGAEKVDFFSWNRAILSFARQILKLDDLIEIPLIVLAMTNSQAVDLQAHPENAVDEGKFKMLLDLMSKTMPFDPGRYGATADEFRPFPADDPKVIAPTITQIISYLEKRKREWVQNQRRQRRGYRNQNEFKLNRVYISYSTQIVSSLQRADIQQRLDDTPCLLIIDPISLLHPDIYQLVLDYGLNGLETAFTIGVAPIISRMHQDLHSYQSFEAELLRKLGLQKVYDRSYSYFEPSLRSAVINVDHSHQLARWLQLATDNITNIQPPEGMNEEWQDKIRASRIRPWLA